jgi:hypothetical protein
VNSNNDRVSTEIQFVLCETCFWCASCFNVDERPITKCPYCDSITLQSIPISSNEGYNFEYNVKRGVTLEFEPRRKRRHDRCRGSFHGYCKDIFRSGER